MQIESLCYVNCKFACEQQVNAVIKNNNYLSLPVNLIPMGSRGALF